MITMFSYTICNCADKDLFRKQCRALEKHIPDIEKGLFLHDVDDSMIQIYKHPKGEVKVFNDTEVDALYIDSEFDLRPYFAE